MCIHNILCRKPIGVFRKAGKRPKKATKVRKDMARIAMITLRRVPIKVMIDVTSCSTASLSCQASFEVVLLWTRTCFGILQGLQAPRRVGNRLLRISIISEERIESTS